MSTYSVPGIKLSIRRFSLPRHPKKWLLFNSYFPEDKAELATKLKHPKPMNKEAEPGLDKYA